MTMPSSRVVVYITAIGWHCRKKQRNRHIPLPLSVTRPSCDSCDYRERGRRNKIDAANEVKCSDFDSRQTEKANPAGSPFSDGRNLSTDWRRSRRRRHRDQTSLPWWKGINAKTRETSLTRWSAHKCLPLSALTNTDAVLDIFSFLYNIK